jgi:hypothetical protein
MAETHKDRMTKLRNGQKRIATHARRTEQRNRAANRVLVRSSRSNAEQIAMLDARLGKGVGAKRERARLQRG